MKKLTEKEVALVGEEIQNTVNLLVEYHNNIHKLACVETYIQALSKMLICGYSEYSTFDEHFNLVKKCLLD